MFAEQPLATLHKAHSKLSRTSQRTAYGDFSV
jgi:hypothetical protein